MAQEPEPNALWIDGDPYTTDDLTYAEQREMREEIRKLVADGDVVGDIEDAASIDLVPAFVYIVKKRSNPEFTMADALQVKPKDLVRPDPPKRAARSGKS